MHFATVTLRNSLARLKVPLAVIVERQGREGATGNLTLDVYTHSDEQQNREAGALLGAAIDAELNSGTVSATEQIEAGSEQLEVFENAA